MDRKITLYRITNNITGQIYFGITGQRLAKRWWRHCNNTTRPDVYIARCIVKYGKENFTIIALDSFSNYEEAFKEEIRLIAKHKTNLSKHPEWIGMNLTDGGDGTVGRPIPDHQRKRQSEMMKGRKNSAEHTENIRLAKLGSKNPMFGKKPSSKSRAMAKDRWLGDENPMRGKKGKDHPMYGKPQHERTKEALRVRNAKRARRVCQLDASGNVIAVFENAKTANQSIGVKNGVLAVCRGLRKSAGGFKWKYFDEIHVVA